MMPKLKRTELIELSFGFKNRKLKKMVQSKAISGSDHPNMSEIGVTTAKKALVFSTINPVINTKVCGHLINVTDKAPIGEWSTKNLDVNTQVTGSKIRNMVEELSSTKMVTDTMVTGSMECPKAKVA